MVELLPYAEPWTAGWSSVSQCRALDDDTGFGMRTIDRALFAMVERAWPGLTKSPGRSRVAVAAKAVDAAAGRTARAAVDLFGDNSNLNRFVLCGAGVLPIGYAACARWSFSGGCRGVLFSAAGCGP